MTEGELPRVNNPGRRYRILLADDERPIVETLALIFRNAGYEVEAFSNGATARNETSGPDVAIIDPVLPDLSGIDLAIDLDTRFPECKILLMSAHSSIDQSDLLAAQSRGYDFQVLPKPFPPEELLERVAAELRRRPQSAAAGS